MRRTTKLGSIVVGVGAGVAAVVWLIKDRLLGPETTPVGAAEAAPFRVAPTATPIPSPAGSDDLTMVKGIGPVYRARLEQAGFTTFAGLASSTAEKIAEAAEVTVERATDWLAQAATLAD